MMNQEVARRGVPADSYPNVLKEKTVTPTKEESKRLSVSLGPSDVRQIAEVVEGDGVTANEAIRRAIQTDAFVRQVVGSGGRILTEDKDGNIREVVFTHLT